MKKTIVIGPATGWLYAKKMYSLIDQKFILEEAGANGVEVSFLPEWFSAENLNRMCSIPNFSKIFEAQNFLHRSVHLPVVNNQKIKLQIAITQKFVAYCNATVALTHPLKVKGCYPIKSYEKMISKGIPLAIENMDSNKESGFKIEELERLIQLVPRFVLDVQHAFERDLTMEYAFDLFNAVKDKLVYLHVSGETEDNHHALVYQSRNCDKIVSFLGTIFSEIEIPIILEGRYSTLKELNQEISFLIKEITN